MNHVLVTVATKEAIPSCRNGLRRKHEVHRFSFQRTTHFEGPERPRTSFGSQTSDLRPILGLLMSRRSRVAPYV